jgi:hypothetical protein
MAPADPRSPLPSLKISDTPPSSPARPTPPLLPRSERAVDDASAAALASLPVAPSEMRLSPAERYREAARLLEVEGAARASGAPPAHNGQRPYVEYSAAPGARTGREADIEVRFSMRLWEKNGARFELKAARATLVQLAGDFNDWRPEPMQSDPASPGCWFFIKPLPRGEYRYKFIVNGEWINDPLNPHRKPNPFGGTDSIVCIEPGPLTAP